MKSGVRMDKFNVPINVQSLHYMHFLCWLSTYMSGQCLNASFHASFLKEHHLQACMGFIMLAFHMWMVCFVQEHMHSKS